MTEFGDRYADAYDHIYRHKDYAAECDALEAAFRRYATTVTTVLDLGCGTGTHAIELARRGYSVVGVDRSPQMLRHARDKASRSGVDVKFVEGDLRSISLDRIFDACISMFTVIGYQLEHADVRAALAGARQHLRAGGVLIFDIWYGPSVLHDPPGMRFALDSQADASVLRLARPTLDVRRQRCTVDYEVWQIDGDRIAARTAESHTLRFFFPSELELLLEDAGFQLVRLGAFPAFDAEPRDDAWTVTCIASAQG